MSSSSSTAFTCLSFTTTFASVVVLSVAVATDFWLHMREQLRLPGSTQAEENSMSINGTWVRVWAGIWRVCMELEEMPKLSLSCMRISYDAGKSRGQSMTITSITIVSSARKSVMLPVLAIVTNLVGAMFTTAGNLRKDVYTLIGAIFHILAGLSLAVGLILYISSVNDEVGYRRHSSVHNNGGFSYRYGWSFFTAAFSFLCSEFCAVIGVTMFIKRHKRQNSIVKIIPGLEKKVYDGIIRQLALAENY